MSKLYVNEVHSKTGSTKALEIDSAGRVTKPQLPHVAVDFGETAGSGTFVSKGANAILPFDNVYEGNSSLWNTSTYKFTAPVGGVYMIAIGLINDGSSTINIDVFVNNIRVLRQGQASSGRYADLCFTKLLSANDVVHFATEQSDSYLGDTGSNRHSFVSITLIG